MKIARHLSAAVIVISFLFPLRGMSQDPVKDHSRGIKLGIVLSGGGAKGFAHIGVLKVLEEENIPIHIVTGTSMGAVVGGLYAVGYTPDQIQKIVLDSDWKTLFNDDFKPSLHDFSTFISNRDTYLLSFPVANKRPRLPTGLINGQNISMLLYRLTLPYHDVQDFSNLPVNFAAVATDLSTGKAHRFQSGYLPDAIRASAAIPSIFKPVKIDGKLYIDGGIARSIPAEDAQSMGADILLVSDVGEPVKSVDSLNTFVKILFQAIGFHQIESDSAQRKLADYYIRPEIGAYNSFSYDKAAKLIQKGEEAAHAIIPDLKARLDSLNIHQPPEKPAISPFYNDTITVTGVDYQNIDERIARQTKFVMDLKPPKRLSLPDIERKINKLYKTQLFSQISYRIRDDTLDSKGKILTMNFNYSEPDKVGFSMRYDSRYKASLLFGAELRNKLVWGDRLSTSLRLGQIVGISTHYSLPIALQPLSKFHIDLDLHRSPIDLYTVKDHVATIDVEQLKLLPSVSIQLFDQWELRSGIHAEFYNLNEAVGNILLLEKSRFLLNSFASFGYNTLSRSYFPTRGQHLQLSAEISSKQFLSELTYMQLFADWQTTVPLMKGIGLITRFTTGYSSSPGLPLQYRFYVGGLTSNPFFDYRQLPFRGYRMQQLSGSNMTAVRSSLQFHIGKDFYLQTGWNAVQISESSIWNTDDFNLHQGYGISLGALTIIGPARISLSTPDFKKNYAFKADIGYTF